MGKFRRRLTIIGGIAAACVLALAVGIPVGVATSSSAVGLDGCDNAKITSKVVAYDNDGNKVNAKDVDTSTYSGFIFTLKDDAPSTYQSKDVLSEFDGQIEYRSASNIYSADSLESIDEFVDEKYIDEIEPNYYVTISDEEADTTELTSAIKAASSSESSAKSSDESKTSGSTTTDPNDPYYSSSQWNLPMMNVSGAWENNLYGQNIDKAEDDNVLVAVVDSGIIGTGSTSSGAQIKHEDIDYSHIKEGVNVVNSQTGTPDTLGHGTFITGLIAAQMNNSKGITGIMPEVDLVPIKIFETRSTSTDIVVEGIYQAIAAKADVINLSLGGEGTTDTMQEACETAVANGIIVVAAAGNDGVETNNYPAAYDCVVGVSSLDEDGTTSYFTNFGEDNVFVSAPGAYVTSLGIDSSSTYKTGSGTSYSCPEVVALGAMARSVFPNMTQDEFMTMLKETSVDKGEAGYDKYYGWGLIDFGAAGEYLLERAYVPIYHIKFNITDQDGIDMTGVGIKLTAAEDIEWEADEEEGIEAGKWEKGHVINPESDGTYSLHKGKYNYVLTKGSYYTKEGTIATYAKNQNVSITMEKTYKLSLNLTDSEGDKIDDAKITLTRSSDGLQASPAQTSTSSSYVANIPEGTYKYVICGEGYEDEVGYLTLGRADMSQDFVLHTAGEVSYVSFECKVRGDDGTTGDEIKNVSIVVKDNKGNIVPPLENGTYQLERGAKYSYTATRAGYEDETGKFQAAQAATTLVTVTMKPSVYYAVLYAVDSDGETISDAEFSLTNENKEAVSPVKTNSSKFNLDAGTYYYSVNCGGYGTVEGSFKMRSTDQYREIKVSMDKVTNKVTITAKDEATDAAIDNASISVYDSDGSLKIKGDSNSWNLCNGTYKYVAYSNGYDAKKGSFVVNDAALNIDVDLSTAQSSSAAFSGGTGEAEDPYLISTEAQLRSIAGNTEYLDKSFKLLCDISLDESVLWTPIGDATNFFTGTFDGAGHSVSGVKVSRDGVGCNGFFGAVKAATIKNLTVQGAIEKSGNYAGGIVGYVAYATAGTQDNSTRISSCQFAGTVRGENYVGGIVGYAYASTSVRINIYIYDCAHTDGLVRAYSSAGVYGNFAGGIVGDANATVIGASYNTGDVTAATYIGGIAGYIRYNSQVLNCYSTGVISKAGTSTSTITTHGGLIGYLDGIAVDCYYMSQKGVNAGIGKSGTYGEQENVLSKSATAMKANGEFTDALNLIQGTVYTDFVTTDSYPVLYWQTTSKAMLSAEKPTYSLQPVGAEYDLNATNVAKLTAKVNAVKDGGTLTYQWYCNDLANSDGAQAVEGAGGTVPESGIIECTPSVSEVGDIYYFAIVTNTSTNATSGIVYRGSTTSDYAKIVVKSDNIAKEPKVNSIGVVDKDGKAVDTPTDVLYGIGAKTDDCMKVDATSVDGGYLVYQWYVSKYADTKGSPVKGATANTLAVNTDTAGVYYYYAAVSNIKDIDGGLTDSAKVKTSRIKVTVDSVAEVPVINSFKLESEDGTEIEDASYFVGEGASDAIKLDASSTDSGTLSYKWYVAGDEESDGTVVDGATGTSLDISTSEEGTYYYYAAVTNTKTLESGKVDSCTTKTDRIKVTVAAKAVAPSVTSFGLVDKYGKTFDNPLAVEYVIDKADGDSIQVNAASSDDGALTYKWYVADNEEAKGSLIDNESDSHMFVGASKLGSYYYYAVITNTKTLSNGKTDSYELVTPQRVKVIVISEDEASANSVISDIDDIAKIDPITLDSEELINKARAEYELLNANARALVKNYDVLVAAEGKLADLKREAATPNTALTLSATASSYNAIKLSWNKDAKAVGYEIYRSVAGGSYSLVKSIYGTAVTTWTDTAVKTGTTYSYKVRAYGQVTLQSGTETLYGQYSAVKSAKPSLTKPKLKLKKGVEKATVKWNKVAGANGYKIYRSVKKGSGYKCVKTIKKGSTLKYVNKKLKGGKKYYYKVRAYKTVNGKKVYSAYSKVKSVKAKK